MKQDAPPMSCGLFGDPKARANPQRWKNVCRNSIFGSEIRDPLDGERIDTGSSSQTVFHDSNIQVNCCSVTFTELITDSSLMWNLVKMTMAEMLWEREFKNRPAPAIMCERHKTTWARSRNKFCSDWKNKSSFYWFTKIYEVVIIL